MYLSRRSCPHDAKALARGHNSAVEALARCESMLRRSSRAALACCEGGARAAVEKISTLLKAVNLSVELYWASLFTKLCERKNVEDLIMNVGTDCGGGADAVAASTGDGGGGGGATLFIFMIWWWPAKGHDDCVHYRKAYDIKHRPEFGAVELLREVVSERLQVILHLHLQAAA